MRSRLTTCILTALLLLIALSGCDEFYSTREYSPDIEVTADCDNIKDVIKEIRSYADMFDKGMILGDVTLQLNDLSPDDYEASFSFSKDIGENRSENLEVEYNSKTKRIFHSLYEVGSAKALPTFTYDLDTSKWKYDLAQSIELLKQRLAPKNITEFDHVTCRCNDDFYEFRIFFSREDHSPLAISISQE